MVIIEFCGFSREEADVAMPTIVKLLGLGHDTYSVKRTDSVMLYDEHGKPKGTGRMIVVPRFATVDASPNILNAISRNLSVPVTTVWAEPKLFIGDKTC